MDLALNDLQEQSVAAFRRLLLQHSTPATVRAAEPIGFDTRLWSMVTDMGIPAMGVPSDTGGLGLSLLDMALVAEVYGEFLAPIPLIETMVVSRLLVRSGASGEGLLSRFLHEGFPFAFVLDGQ